MKTINQQHIYMVIYLHEIIDTRKGFSYFTQNRESGLKKNSWQAFSVNVEYLPS